MAPNAKIVDYRVLGPDNTGAGDALLACLRHAVEAGYRVINMSLAAKVSFGPQLLPLCDKVYRNGQVIVAAKRQYAIRDLGYPAEISTVVSVDRTKFEAPWALRLVEHHRGTSGTARTCRSQAPGERLYDEDGHELRHAGHQRRGRARSAPIPICARSR